MSLFRAETESAYQMLRQYGKPVVIRQEAPHDVQHLASQGDYGKLTAVGRNFEFEFSGIDAVVSVDDTIRLKNISEFANRGPFQVLEVSGSSLKVDKELVEVTENSWLMEVSHTAVEMASGVGIALPPKSSTGQQYDQDYRDGTLQISYAQDIIISAKGLGLRPRKGNAVQLDRDTWSQEAETWLIHGLTAVPNDFDPVIYLGVIKRG